MKDDALSGRQLICITWLFLLGSFSVTESESPAGRDAWISLILAVAAMIPLVFIYARISALFGDGNLFDILTRVFGKWLGGALSLCVTLYCLLLAVLTLHDFPVFVQATSLPRTPKVIFAVFLGAACAYLAALGPRSFGKAGILFSAVAGFIIIATLLLLIPTMDINNLRPLMGAPWGDIGQNAAMLIAAPFGESVLLLCLFCGAKAERGKYKAYFLGLIFGGAFMLAAMLRDILSLGAGNFISLPYPSYSAMSTINIGEYFQRAEVIAESGMLLCDIVKIAVSIYAAALGASRLLNISDYKKIVPPLSIAMIALSLLAPESLPGLLRQYPQRLAYCIPIQAVIPVILWVWGELRIGANKKLYS